MMRSSFILVSSVCVATMSVSIAAADVLAYQGFEGSAQDTWAYTIQPASDSAVGYVSDMGLSSYYPTGSSIVDGTKCYLFTGISSTGTSPSAGSILFSSVSLTNYSSAAINILIASLSSTSGNGHDSQDYVAVYIAFDGADFSDTADIILFGNSNARWNFTATGVLSTIAGTDISATAPYSGGTNSSKQYGSLVVTLPEGHTSVSMKIITANNGGSSSNPSSYEIWGIDGVTLSATAVPEPASLALLGLGGLLLIRQARAKLRR